MFVSGQASPDAKVRLFLNDSSVAEGQASHDGRVTFDVKSGAQPGDCRVRLVEVDGRSGSIKSHAEADFAVPAEVAENPSAQVDHTGAVVVPQIHTTVVSRGVTFGASAGKRMGEG
jgi:hypothetical protein